MTTTTDLPLSIRTLTTDDEILTTEAAAEFAKMSPRLLKDLLATGQVAGRFLPGPGGWRTTKGALLAWARGEVQLPAGRVEAASDEQDALAGVFAADHAG